MSPQKELSPKSLKRKLRRLNLIQNIRRREAGLPPRSPITELPTQPSSRSTFSIKRFLSKNVSSSESSPASKPKSPESESPPPPPTPDIRENGKPSTPPPHCSTIPDSVDVRPPINVDQLFGQMFGSPPAQRGANNDINQQSTQNSQNLNFQPTIHKSFLRPASLPAELLPLLLEGVYDIDFIRLTIQLTQQFYEDLFDVNDWNEYLNDRHPSPDDIGMLKMLHREERLFQHIINKLFLGFVGTGKVKAFGSICSKHSLEKRMSVHSEKPFENYPLAPREMHGNEYALIRWPVEISIPKEYVEPVIHALQLIGHHVGLRSDWAKSHIIINDITIANNPPPIADIFRALAHAGCTYFSLVIVGQR